MDTNYESELIFEFFESRIDLKNKFYDSLYTIIFDDDENVLKNLLISYHSQIVDYHKIKSEQKGVQKKEETVEKTTKKQKKPL